MREAGELIYATYDYSFDFSYVIAEDLDMQANHIRRAHARAALKQYIKVSRRTPDSMKSDIVDLMTDLLHLADLENIDSANILFLANENFRAETQKEA